MAKHDTLARRIFEDSVQWVPKELMGNIATFDYAVFRFPFVPDFHLCLMDDADDTPDGVQVLVLSTHKKLEEAMNICKLLLATGGIHRD
jgi:hypothetical protein